MPAMRGIRARLTVTLVALVALTAILLGVGAYLFVESSLHAQALSDARSQAGFDLSVTVPTRGLPVDPAPEDVIDSGLRQTFLQRGIESIIDVGGGQPPIVSNEELAGALPTLPADLVARVNAGELAFAWTHDRGEAAPDRRWPAVGRRAGVLLRPRRQGDRGCARAAPAGAHRRLADPRPPRDARRAGDRPRVLAPVEAAGRAAERIERGDLSARVPVTSNDEFGTWAERFNRMAEALGDTIGRLEAAEAQNRRFVADVAHELRTPLAALVAEASILREHLGELPPESRRAGELLVSDVGRLRALVDDLMEVSRFDARAEQIALEPVDLAGLVATVAAARLPEAALDLPGEPLVVETDPRRLERILGNLLDNAREHAAGAPVEVTLAAEGDAIVLSVADRGPGVPPDRLERIFERFYKADPSRHGGSSGLGLAIAAEHAALLGGTLSATNRPDGGLRIELRLPVTGSLPRSDGTAISGADAGTPNQSVQETQS